MIRDPAFRNRQARPAVRILLLEDDRLFAGRVEAQLRRMPGLESRLEVVDSLAEATARLAAGSFDLIVTDLDLPDSNGLATVQALARLGDQPIIALSGDASPALRAGVIEAGAYDFLQKDQLSAAALDRLARIAALQAGAFRALRESESRFRSLIDLSSDFYWESDAAHRVTRTEHGSRRHPAVNPAQLGKARWDMPSTHPDAEGWAAHRATMQAHRPFQDFEIARRDGDTERWRSLSGEPVFDEKGAFKGYRGIGKDITERKRAEEALRRFRLALDTSPDMILLIDRESMRHLDVNTTACQLLGYTREELLERGPQDILPMSRNELERLYDQMTADCAAVSGMRSYYRCKDGSQLPFESTRRVLRSGERWIIAVISRDIRAHLKAEKALAEGEARFRSLTALSSDWYWEQDERLRLTFMSSIEKLGLDPANYVGKHRWDQPALNLTDADWARHRAQLERHEPFRDFEIERPAPGGQSVWIALSGEPVFDAAGRFAGYRGVGRDITQRKRAERKVAELGRMNAALGAANEAVLRARSPQEVFERACDVAVAAGGFQVVTVFGLDAATGRLERLAASGVAAPALKDVRRTIDASQPGRGGLLGHACRERKPAIANDYATDPRTVGRRSEAKGYPIGSGAAFPLLVGGELVGTFGLQHAERDAFSDELIGLVQRLADNIAFALENFQREAGRQEAKRGLQESEARFRSLTEISSDIYWEQDHQHRFTLVSGTSAALQESARAQMIGKRRWDRHYFNMTEAAWAAHRADLDARRPFRDLELGRVNPQGETVWVSVSGEPRFDHAGAFSGYHGVGRDITKRKRAQQLRELEHTVTQSLAEADSLPGALQGSIRAVCTTEGWECGRYFAADGKAGVLRFSVAWGVEDEPVQRFIAGSHDITYAEGEGLAGRVWQTGEPLWITDISEDGRSARPALSRASGMRGAFIFPVIAEGATIGVLTFNTRDRRQLEEDLMQAIGVIGSQIGQFVQRKQAEAQRLLLELQFRRTFELAGTGLAHIGLDRRFVRVNRRLCEIFGFPEAELLGRAAKEFSHPDDLDVINSQRPRLYAGEIDAVRGEKRYLRKDGSTVWLAYTVAVERDARGQALYEITAYDDVTERKRAEQRQAAHLRYQERVARFGQSALVKSAPAELVERAVQAVLEALAADAVGYLEAGPAAGELVLRALVGVADAAATPGPIACAPGDPIQQVVSSGGRMLVDGAQLPLAWARDLRSAALIPVRGDNKIRGVLCVFYRQPDAFRAEELNFVEAMATLLSTALQRIDSEGRLAYLAQFDPLTGLPNRALLADRFSQMIVQAKRRGSPLAVLFIDLDEFKMVNDTLGHAGGDALLKEVAVRLQSTVRSGDTVARISGDEFAIVLADLARADDAALVAQKVIDRLAATVDIAGKEVFVTASVGIAAFPGDGADAEALIGAADAAMYRAKQGGRNAYQFYTAEINQRSRARAQMGAELRRALEREEFTLFYQPKVDLATRQANGVEALLRWRHPERGLVSPMEFIPVLEETGLIVQVGDWVLRRACDDLKAWQAAGLAVVRVAVNLSARQFRHADLDQRIKALVASAAIDPGLIELEITESQLMQDPAHAIRVMRALRDAGMRIAIDDFGTGYSSLAYLHRFPVSALKIDRSFVKDMAKSKDDATIVRTIIEMAHSLGFTVVAEGVETEEQATFLRLLRCEQAQGYLFARPMAAEDYLKLLSRS